MSFHVLVYVDIVPSSAIDSVFGFAGCSDFVYLPDPIYVCDLLERDIFERTFFALDIRGQVPAYAVERNAWFRSYFECEEMSSRFADTESSKSLADLQSELVLGQRGNRAERQW